MIVLVIVFVAVIVFSSIDGMQVTGEAIVFDVASWVVSKDFFLYLVKRV